MKTKIILTSIMLFLMHVMLAQSLDLFVIASGGNFMSNQDVSLSATLGELMTETYSKTEIILTQGFQQSRLEVDTRVTDRGSEWSIMVFPNPVTDELKIDFFGDYRGKISIELFDMKGRKIIHQSMDKSSLRDVYTLGINNIERGIYILKITNSDFRINKITRIEIQ